MEVLLTFFEQLVLPFGVLLPIRSLRIGAATQRPEDEAVPLVLVGFQQLSS